MKNKKYSVQANISIHKQTIQKVIKMLMKMKLIVNVINTSFIKLTSKPLTVVY